MTNSVFSSGEKYGPVISQWTGPFAKRNAMPLFGPDVGMKKSALFLWYAYSLAMLRLLDEMSVTTQRLPALSKTRLSGLEKPSVPGVA